MFTSKEEIVEFINNKRSNLINIDPNVEIKIKYVSSIKYSYDDFKLQYEAYDEESNPAQKENLRVLFESAKEEKEKFETSYPWILEENLPEFTGITLTPEQEESLSNEQLMLNKQLRDYLVNNIVITTSNNNSFDGDETSQTRMVRAISSMTDVDLISWKLADNTVKEVSKSELAEALKLAGLKQTEYWFI